MKTNRYTNKWMTGMAFLVSALSIGLVGQSCTSNNDEGSVSADYMRVTDVVMSGNHASTTLHIEADCSWKISEDAAWLTVNPVQGKGTTDVELTTGVNPSSIEERSCQLTVTTDGGVVRTITLNQTKNDESMTISTEKLTFAESGGEQVFTVTSNTIWSISGGADWLTLSTTEGTDNGSVNVTATANNTEYERQAVITVTGNSGTAAQLTVTQLGKDVTLSIEPERIDAAAKSRTYSFQVMSNVDWTVTADVTTWVSIGQRNGSNDGIVEVTLTDNTASEARTANIHVTTASGKQERTCVITQAGATVPSMTQPTITGITRYEAVVTSTFTSSLDATQGGFCYSTQPSPTINDKMITVEGVSGTSGELNVSLTGLTSGQTYYVRAWVRNANGIGYSSDATFTTEGKKPGEDDNPTPDL